MGRARTRAPRTGPPTPRSTADSEIDCLTMAEELSRIKPPSSTQPETRDGCSISQTSPRLMSSALRRRLYFAVGRGSACAPARCGSRSVASASASRRRVTKEWRTELDAAVVMDRYRRWLER